jgi:hypothetical protein
VLLKLAADPELCARSGTQNRARIREHYGSLRMCDATADVLAGIQ